MDKIGTREERDAARPECIWPSFTAGNITRGLLYVDLEVHQHVHFRSSISPAPIFISQTLFLALTRLHADPPKNYLPPSCNIETSQSEMANSQYEYVKSFETNDSLLPNTYLVVRIDGHAFHRFTTLHHFSKPNDLKGIHLMSHAAKQVMAAMEGTCVCAYGISDEFSFVFKRSYSSYNRRASYFSPTVLYWFRRLD